MLKDKVKILWVWLICITVIILCHPLLADVAQPEAAAPAAEGGAWWLWPLILFFFCLVLGVFAVLAGVGGGVLYVPLVSGLFPFHLDFVRGAGLMVALAGALAAGPGLLRRNLANLRLVLPLALIASSFSIVGAFIGLALPTNVVQICLGVTIVFIVALIALSKNVERPIVTRQDFVGRALGMSGACFEMSTNEEIAWKTHRTGPALIMFCFVGLVAGMFGLGAGWANVPVLNLFMGAPLKIAVGSSKFLLSITDVLCFLPFILSFH